MTGLRALLLCMPLLAAAHTQAAPPAAVDLDALTSARRAALAAGEPAEAERLARLQIELAAGDRVAAAQARLGLGEILRRQGRIDEAQPELTAALDTLRAAAGAERLRAQALSALAQLHRNRGDYYEALDLESEALSLRRALDPPERPHLSLFSLAALHEQMEDFEHALVLQKEALEAARADPEPGAEASAMTRLAGLLNDVRAHQPEEALGYASLAFAIHERLGNRPGMLDARFHIARAHLNAGRLDEAERLFGLAFDEAIALRQRGSQAHIQFRRAELQLLRGQPQLARVTMEDAIARYIELGNRHRLAKAHGVLATILDAAGDAAAAREARLEHFRLRDELLGAAATRRVTALLERMRRDAEAARIDMLERDNRIQELQLARQADRQRTGILLLVSASVMLALLGWRLHGVGRANRTLQAQSLQLERQQQALGEANQRLAEQAETLRTLAEMDGLTGVANRRHGMGLLRTRLQQAREDAADLGVLILDIDHFKHFNDEFGHPLGDEVLREVAAVLREVASRPGHLVARLGGEEFLIVVPDAGRPETVAEQLRERIAALRIDHHGQVLSLTASLGVVRRSQLPEAEVPDLLRAADLALYVAKRGGRNRVEHWSAPAGDNVVDLHG